MIESILILILTVLSYILTTSPGLWFFFQRNPSQKIKKSPQAILSPADGTITEIIKNKDTIFINIFISANDVHTQYFPMDGIVTKFKHQPGKFNPAFLREKTKDNERATTVLTTRIGDLHITQIAGVLANRIITYNKPYTFVEQGEPLGRIILGSTCQLIIPQKGIQKLSITLGQHVKGGRTKIAII